MNYACVVLSISVDCRQSFLSSFALSGYMVLIGVRALTFVDIFSGAGGSALGFVRAGFRPLAAIDKYIWAVKTYTVNIGIRPVRDDAFSFDWKIWAREIGDVDVLVGCPPCQGFSRLRLTLSRKYDGIGEDPRNKLLLVYLHAVEALRPRAVVFENVPWVEKSGYFRLLVDGLRKLGYCVRWAILDAADYGVPQHRKRLILVGLMRQEPLNFPPPPTHGRPGSREVREGLREPWRTVRQAISDLPPLKPGEEHPAIPNHVAKRLPPHWLELIKHIPKDGGSRHDVPPELLLPAHRRLGRGGFNDVFGRLWWDRPSVTVTTGCGNPSKGRYVHPEQDRGLSLRECARLQGFPDDFIFLGPPSSVARQIGEALPPPLAEAVAKTLREMLP